MSDEEDDYMSEAFLQSLDDKRPGLIHGKKQQELIRQERIRAKDAEHREQQRLKSRKRLVEQMLDTREEALATSLVEAEPENKGLKLMLKMGFKPGTGLGPAGEGRKIPVPINDVKMDKKGVGIKERERERERTLIQLAQKRRKMNAQNQKTLTKSYKQNARQRAYQQRVFKFVAQSQKALYELDSQNNITEADNPLHWPKFARAPEKEEEEEAEKAVDDSETTIDQKLALMADPLNSQFILEKRERSDETGHDLHHQSNDIDNEEIDHEALLEELTIVLRARYFYCVYCGCAYENELDLTEHCPGDEYDDHE